MNYKKEFYEKLKSDKIKINMNKSPIKMVDFLSFLTVPLERSKSHLGDINGWTKLFNNQIKLEIIGGVLYGIEYLDSIKYGSKLSSPYNDFVNPFYLFEIMNSEGKLFFANYYKEEIDQIITSIKSDIDFHNRKAEEAANLYDGVKSEVTSLLSINNNYACKNKMNKVYDETLNSGVYSDDDLNAIARLLTPVSHKPTANEAELVNGDVGDMSYYTILDKKVRIILYIED